jgi:hypothetical protein
VTLLTCGRCLDSLPLRPFHQESTPRHRSRKREIRSSFSGSCSPPRLRAIPSSRPLKPRLWRPSSKRLRRVLGFRSALRPRVRLKQRACKPLPLVERTTDD